MLNEIDKELISGSYHAMYLEEVFDCGKTLAEITDNYLRGLTSTVQRCLFNDVQSVSELDEFISQFEREYYREK